MYVVGPVTVASRLLATLLFASFVIGQAPHSVHHLFELEPTGDECPFATAGERLPGLGADVIGFDHGLTWGPAVHRPAPSRFPGRLVQGPLARAPPRLVSSLASLSS
ncbi:MAG: hypothetical protein ACREJV_09515, partial [Candidatus Rokuibacteriota bacterium]